MFGWLKKLRRKREDLDYEDIKSGVLGRDEFMPETRPIEEREPSRFEPSPEFRRTPEPIGFERPSEPISFEPEPRTSREYDILDRLNLIETNLLVIRSQTETINERLKNLEMKITRRY